MKKYTHLFFDLDHTLWDFEQNSVASLQILYNEAELHQKGIPSFEEFNLIYHEINDRLWDRFRKGFMSREDLRWKRMWQTLVHFRVLNEGLARQMSERYLDILPTQRLVFPNCFQMLDYCKNKQYEMHLITNGFEQTQWMKLKNAGLDSYFNEMITSERAMSMKPQKEIFEYALRETGASASSSLMIGDALDIDILGASTIGMHQVYFNPHEKPHSENPTYEINDLIQLTQIL
ncbi:MAG TPA: YjjG family noncanonical pyrimidine nucleotidase [Chitinophagaceae bacterium]|nr:YjjG family noncanonical pyrimidine nucleotidase [Chitinophagaceae bacterium]HNF72104.1 YjjG family noncanonical pyrimidine nucleotidase [Chitinophagaceae bacterium]